MKRITDTSRAALQHVERTLPTREANVLDALARMTARAGLPPTAYELLKFMQIAEPLLDLNAVRPRLTSLADAGKVEKADKRACSVTGIRVATWRIKTPPAQPQPRVEREIPAVQMEMSL